MLEAKLPRRHAGDDSFRHTDAERDRPLITALGLMIVRPSRLGLDLPGVLEINCVEVLAAGVTRRVCLLTGDVPYVVDDGGRKGALPPSLSSYGGTSRRDKTACQVWVKGTALSPTEVYQSSSG